MKVNYLIKVLIVLIFLLFIIVPMISFGPNINSGVVYTTGAGCKGNLPSYNYCTAICQNGECLTDNLDQAGNPTYQCCPKGTWSSVCGSLSGG